MRRAPVTAAPPRGSRQGRQARRAINSRTLVFLFAIMALHASPSAAQTNTTVSLFSDLRFRGYSLSDGRPVGILDLSYDARSGLYGAISGSVASTRDEGLKPLGLIVNGGFARQVSPRLSLDVGVTHSAYSRYSDRGAKLSYTEAYAGISGKLVSARVSVSPDYVRGGSLYGEVNGNWPLAKRLSLTAHAGIILPFRTGEPEYGYSHDVDWKLGVAKVLGPLSLTAAWTGVRGGRDAYRLRGHKRDALVIGLSYSL